MRMAPIVAVVVAVALVMSVATQADVNMLLLNSWGIHAFGQGPGGTYIPAGTLIQLIWSPDNAVSPLAALLPNMLDSSEKLLYSTFGPEVGGWGGGVTDLDGANIYLDSGFGTNLANGYIYARIFDVAAPWSGDHYFDSGLADALEWTNVPPGTTSLDVAPGGATDPGWAVNQTIAAIPEPMSMALFGVGLVSIAILRLRRK